MKKRYFFLFFLIIIIVFSFLIFLPKPFPLLSGKLPHFNWLAQDKKETKSFSFVVAGDNHNNIEVYNKLIQKVNASRAVFLVDLGDITRVGGASEYNETRAALNNLKIPYHMVIGDHDIVGNGYEIWEEFFGPTYYSWDYGNGHFIALNDVVNKDGFSEEQLAWLERDLSRTAKEIKIVFLHRPPKCPLAEPGDLGFTGSRSQERIEQFFSLAKKYGVDKIYAGHFHNLLNYSVGGIPITVTGGAGGPLYRIPLLGENRYHFLEVEIQGSNIRQKVVEL